MRQFTHDWLPESLSKRWREFVLPRLKHPLRWLELGSYEGRSACWVIDNVLEDEDIRQGIKAYANWPTIPQLYVNGEFVGGSDIMMEMYQTGELQQLLSSAH